ncbi:MAG: hydroxyethylthiazole kinase [Eubacteriales bacterium]|nr:hydroxyethylthiazole kinase [Eubacteriales bacterium]
MMYPRFILEQVRETEPVIQCITNFVTVNDCANILLAAGATPTMAQDIREAEEAIQKNSGLVCNMGAIDMTESMLLAGRMANKLGKPVVLDPVGAGGTVIRRSTAAELLSGIRFTAIRGNASEIKALAGVANDGIGVDVGALDKISEANVHEYAELCRKTAARLGTVIAISGPTDVISDGSRVLLIRNGDPVMARITGSGCMLTTLIGAFAAVPGADMLEAVASAVLVMDIAGELAKERLIMNHTGNATFRNDLIDAVFNMTAEEYYERSRVELIGSDM